MQTRMVILLGVLFFIGCAGTRSNTENPELQPWAGMWQGLAIQESHHDQPQQWTLILSQKNGKLHGKLSDDIGEMRRKKLEEIKLIDGELHFKVQYETRRGLHMTCQHRIKMQDDTLLSVFSGMEGGRALSGVWEARRMIVKAIIQQ